MTSPPLVYAPTIGVMSRISGAAENLVIAAGARGRPSELAFDPAGEGSLQVQLGDGQARDIDLCDAIPKRQSTRADNDGRPVSPADLRQLEATARVPGVDLVFITDRPRIDQIRDLVLAGNSAQTADPAFVRELKSWLRFSPNEAMRTGDALFSAASGSPAPTPETPPSVTPMSPPRPVIEASTTAENKPMILSPK